MIIISMQSNLFTPLYIWGIAHFGVKTITYSFAIMVCNNCVRTLLVEKKQDWYYELINTYMTCMI